MFSLPHPSNRQPPSKHSLNTIQQNDFFYVFSFIFLVFGYIVADEMFDSVKKEVLVEMVKLSQKRWMAGDKGTWKEFLKSYDKKLGSSLSDPSRRDADALVAFLKTFTQKDDIRFFKKLLQGYENRDAVEEFKKTSLENETAEQKLVRMTLGHPMYPVDYSFSSYEEDWLVTKCSKKSKALQSTTIIAIDCEMVLCEDGTEAVVKVCAVDRNLEVKLDEFVNPNKVIADYRSDITGVSATDLNGVTCSLKDVQKSLKKLLSHGTILVGHGLNNDLRALKLDHTRVIDTSYIFKYANGSVYRRPSLSFLCKAMLGFDLRKIGKPHNCLKDAEAAMKLVLARLEGKIEDIIPEEARELDEAKLLVHKIPIKIHSDDLKKVIPGEFTIQIHKKAGDTYSAFAIFKNLQEAVEAFKNLEGVTGKDSFGRPQKLVKFVLDSGISGSLCVCNTTLNHHHLGESENKRPMEDASTHVASKKLKTEQFCEGLNSGISNGCEMHLKEIERLKDELRKKDDEISDLNKIIVALIRKQGL